MARPSDDDDLARRVANLKEREGIDPNDMTSVPCAAGDHISHSLHN